MLGAPLQDLSARRPGWRVTCSAVAVHIAVAAMAALPRVALAQTPSVTRGASDPARRVQRLPSPPRSAEP